MKVNHLITQLVFLLLILSTSLTSCQKTSVLEEEVAFGITTVYPKSINTYVATYHPETAIKYVFNVNRGLIKVVLADQNHLYFRRNGLPAFKGNRPHDRKDKKEEGDDTHGFPYEHCGEDRYNGEQLSINSLPSSIVTYIEEEYEGAEIIKAYQLPHGKYRIRLNNGILLYFDENGEVLYVETEFKLRFSSLQLPDTIQIGTTVTLSAHLVNEKDEPFIGDLLLPYGIEDELPDSLSNTQQDGAIEQETILIAANDSIEIKIPIFIAEELVNSQTYDIVIVWPEVTTNHAINPYVEDGGHNYTTAYIAE